ncbi:MAG: Ca2+-transporting ATPase [Hydrogenophaga sp.]|jgi:Ca2+-transporting ATPase
MPDPKQAAVPPDDPSLSDIADLISALGTEEAAKRLHADGPNELRPAPAVPAWRRALAQLQDPLVYLLGAAAAVALAAWWFEGRGQSGAAGWPLDAIVITGVVVLNAVLGWLQESKAAQAVAALAMMTTATSAVMRDGAVARVPSAELVKGDVLVLAEGDAVGADARLAQAAARTGDDAGIGGRHAGRAPRKHHRGSRQAAAVGLYPLPARAHQRR